MFQFRAINYLIFYFSLMLYGGCKDEGFHVYDFLINNPLLIDSLNKLYIEVPLSYNLISKLEKENENDMNTPFKQFNFYSTKHLDSISVTVIYQNLYKKNDFGLFETYEYCFFDNLVKLRKCEMNSPIREKAFLYFRRTFINDVYYLNCDLFGSKLRDKLVLRVTVHADGIKILYVVNSSNLKHLENDFYSLPNFIKIK